MSTNQAEKNLIEYIRSRSVPREGLPGLGIGDDAAFLMISSMDEGKLLVSTDSVIEGVHFRPDWGSYADAAVKLFERVCSDILAKGGHPHWMLLNLNVTVDFARDASRYRGFIDAFCERLADRNVALIGGDVSRSPVNSFTGTVFGNSSTFVMRHNPEIAVGDLLVIQGRVGGSSSALDQLVAGENQKPVIDAQDLGYYTRPQAQWNNGWLRDPGALSSMDQSDSLWETFSQLCDDNQIRLRVDLEKIPLHQTHQIQAIPTGGFSPADHARQILKAAEDLAIVAIMPAAKMPEIMRDATLYPDLKIIGEVSAAGEVRPGMDLYYKGYFVNLEDLPDFYTHF